MPSRRNSPNNQFNNSNKNTDSQYSGLLNKYSQSLDKSVEGLNNAAKSFNTTSKNLSNSMDFSVDKFNKSLVEFAKAFNKDTEELEKVIAESNKKSNEDNKKHQDDVVKSYQDIDNKNRRTGQFLIKAFEVSGGLIVRKFKSAMDSVMSNYESSLSGITVRMQQTNREYTHMLNKVTDTIKADGLQRQFSQVDYNNSLQQVLSTGLRGSEAERQAYSNLITNKLLPALSTTSRTYMRGSKLLGDSFNDSVLAVSKYTEKLYGAEGIEEGGIDSFLQTLQSDLMYSGVQQGMTPEEISKSIAEAFIPYQQATDLYGRDVSDQILSELRLVTSGQYTSASDITQQAAANADIRAGDSSSLTPDNIAEFFNQIIQFNRSSGMAPGQAASTGAGYNEEIMKMVKVTDKLGKSTTSILDAKEGFDVNKEMSQWTQYLQEGQGQTITDQYSKMFENSASFISNILSENFPEALVILGGISSILGSWWKSWLSSRSSSGQSLDTNLFNGKGTSSKAFKDAWKGTEGGLLAKGKAGLGASKATLSTAGTVAGSVALAGGLLWAGHDAGSSVKRAIENDLSAGQVIGQGARGLFLGNTTAGMTKEEEQEYYKSRGYKINWGEAFQNAGKWGLVGAGAGTLAGGGVGTAIGGAVGAVGGFAGSAIDQVSTMWDDKQLNKASEELAGSLDALTKSTKEYQNVVNSTSSSLSDLEVIQNNQGIVTEETVTAFNNLKKTYPEYLGNVKDVSELDSIYIDILKSKIEYEQSSSQKDLLENFNTAFEDAEKKIEESQDKLENLGGYAEDFKSYVETNKLDITSHDNMQSAVKQFINDYSTEHGVSSLNVEKGLVNAGILQHTAMNSEGNYDIKDSAGKWYWDKDEKKINQNYTSYIGSLASESLSNNNKGQEAKIVKDLFDDLEKLYDQVESLYNDYNDYNESSDNTIDKDAILSDLKIMVPKFASNYSKNKSTAETVGRGEEFTNQAKESFPKYEEIYKKVIGDFPGYKSGTPYVTYDNQLALLHKGEAVLTASNADRLRKLSSNDFTTYLSSLEVQSKATPVTESSTSISTTGVVDAINSQTARLSESLSVIIELITQLTESGTTPSLVPNMKLLTYQGV